MDKARTIQAMETGTFGALIASAPVEEDLDLALAFGGAPDPELAPEPEAEPEPLTVQQAKAMGFDDAAIAALREAGLFRETRDGQPWRPETLVDVDWVILQHKLLDTEEKALAEQYQRRMKAVANRRRWLESYSDDCLAITHRELPRKKDGKFAKKSLDLEYGRTKLTASSGGPKVADELAVLEYIRQRHADGDVPAELASALKVTETAVHQGADALKHLDAADNRKFKVLSDPVKAYVSTLPPIPDEHGEAKPRVIPGVVIEEPSERWGWE